LIETSTLPLGYHPNHGKRLVVCHRWLGLTRYYVTCIRPEARPVAHRKIQESPAFADKPSRRESMPKIAPIRRAYNVVADNTGLFSFVYLLLRPKPAKFSENSNLWSSGWSKVIDLGANRKRICTFLLATNSNFGRISYRFRDIDAFSSK